MPTNLASPTEIRYCEHAVRVIRIEAPAITELVAAMAHLDKALAADPTQTTTHYASQGQQDLVPAWIHDNADKIRARLDTLTSHYPHLTTSTDTPTAA
ncbi:hypothetical protein OG497_39405 [Streptomyces sp. NBC_01242]|uniref:hypothetical protein n=1 Tax=Streptomyces sp. NBC_01242 TaxID=2903795 RepID=UPI00225843C2|nr:hypothetical protein [Streptomyces sp. NBC_01242]MCX4799911.1 hypothetical protein [Streptomyces sp. NBC_01242]